jgi:hypothetical protein
MHRGLIAAAALLAVCGTAPVSASVIIDQLGNFDTGFASQRFEASFTQFDVGVLDDFSLAGATTITSVSAGILGYNGLSNFGNIQSYSVEIYSSLAAAGANLIGDAGHAVIAPGSVTLTNPGYSYQPSALVVIPVSISLAAGNYWLAVIPRVDFNGNGQSGIGGYGEGNATQANPNGGFGQGTTFSTGRVAAYRIDGTGAVPEPASWMLMVVGFGLAGASMRRRSAVVAA